MYDTNSRYTTVTRMNEERLAEARRSHLLRAAREDRDAYDVRPAHAARGRVSIGSILASVRRGVAHSGRGVQSAAAR